LNGVTLSLVEKGSGQPVVLVHGSLSDYRAWEAQFAALSGDFRALAYSRRCAYPNKRRDYENSTVENNADDLARLLSAKDASPAHLIGHSYGGFIALYCAFKNPALVRSLVLVEPHVPTLLVSDPQNRLEAFGLLLRRPSLVLAAQRGMNALKSVVKAVDEGLDEGAVELFFTAFEGKREAYINLPSRIKSMLVANAGTIKEVMTKTPPFTPKEARTIRAPTLVISGENTTKVLAAVAKELSRNIRKVRVAKVSNSAHFPHFENPEGTNSEIGRFLSEQS
jgi:pimeloyl-ACP methyl ester carboxylesterase